MKIPRILITADRSSSGKTTVVIGLMKTLKNRGYDIQGFKVGLDYIDPSYHDYITGNKSRNLDGFVMEEEDIRNSFVLASEKTDISIIEGVRGLYEGIEVESNIGSTYQIAKLLKTPVILVMDVSSITKTAAAILNGINNFQNVNIGGVILNGVNGKKHEKKLKKSINKYTDIEVLGLIPKTNEINIEMRHLGLIPAKEMNQDHDIEEKIKNISKLIKKNVDIDRIIEISKETKPLKEPKNRYKNKKNKKKTKIGIANDKAFNFYYQNNLNLLKKHGANLIKFSPISDNKIPEEVDGLYIGGGYPELFADKLANNNSIKKDILNKAKDGMPIFAECGGLLYLLNELETEEGKKFPMVGLFDGIGYMEGKRVIGYVKGKTNKQNLLGEAGQKFKGHEFHYSSIKDLDEQKFAFKITRGKGIRNSNDGLMKKNVLATYCHLNFLSFEIFPKNFVKKCVDFKYK